jgi:hypothetical protein
VPDQPVEDRRRPLRAPARRARQPVQQQVIAGFAGNHLEEPA